MHFPVLSLKDWWYWGKERRSEYSFGMSFCFWEWMHLIWDRINKVIIKRFRNFFFVEYFYVFHCDKIGKRVIGDSFVPNNFFYNIPRFFNIIFVWINNVWIIVFLWFVFQRFEKCFVLFTIQLLLRVWKCLIVNAQRSS